MSVWRWGRCVVHVCTCALPETPGHRSSESFQEFRILYFVRHNVEAWSLSIGRCSYILKTQNLHCEGVKATDEVSHEDWSLDIKN